MDWSQKRMKSAVIAVQEGNGLRSAARMFDVPLETLRRRVIGSVPLDCKPGPKTVLSKEDLIFWYCITKSEMGYGIGRDDFMWDLRQLRNLEGHTHLRKALLGGHDLNVL